MKISIKNKRITYFFFKFLKPKICFRNPMFSSRIQFFFKLFLPKIWFRNPMFSSRIQNFFDCNFGLGGLKNITKKKLNPRRKHWSRFTTGENQDCALKILIFKLNLDHSKLENQDFAWKNLESWFFELILGLLSQNWTLRPQASKLIPKSRFTIGENQDCALKILIFELNLDNAWLENQDCALKILKSWFLN